MGGCIWPIIYKRKIPLLAVCLEQTLWQNLTDRSLTKQNPWHLQEFDWCTLERSWSQVPLFTGKEFLCILWIKIMHNWSHNEHSSIKWVPPPCEIWDFSATGFLLRLWGIFNTFEVQKMFCLFTLKFLLC